MAKKDLKQGMAHGLASLTQNPTKEKEADAEPKAEQAEQIIEPQQEQEPEPQRMVPVGVKKNKGAGLYQTRQAKPIAPSITAGLRNGYTRATIIAKQDTLAKIREIAYLERAHTMDIVEEALAGYLEKYEAEHGKIRLPKPKKQ